MPRLELSDLPGEMVAYRGARTKDCETTVQLMIKVIYEVVPPLLIWNGIIVVLHAEKRDVFK